MARRVLVRDRAVLDTDALALLLDTSRAGLTKRIQRGGLPSPLKVKGRSRLWSYSQIEHLVTERIRRALPAHIALDPRGEHSVEFRGPVLADDAVTFWFLVANENGNGHGVGYWHPTYRAGGAGPFFENGAPPIPSTLPTFTVGPSGRDALAESHSRIMLSGELSGAELKVWNRLRGALLSEQNGLLDLEELLGVVLPTWPLGAEDPELMVQWTPGSAPVEFAISSYDIRLLSEATAAGRVDTGGMSLQPFDYYLALGHLKEYLEHPDPRSAIVDSSARERYAQVTAVLESAERAALEGVSEAPARQSFASMLTEVVLDDAVALHLIDDDCEHIPLRLAPPDAVPTRLDPELAATLAAFALASLVGFPRQLLEWGRGDDGSVMVRRHGRRWWTTGPLAASTEEVPPAPVVDRTTPL